MSTKFPGFQTVKKGSAVPVRRRFTDPSAVYAIYDNLKTMDQADAKRRAVIRNVVSGALPYSKAQLRAKGLAHMTNLNFGKLKNALDARSEAIMRLNSDTCDLIELVPVSDGSAGPNDQYFADIAAQEFSVAVRREGHLIPALATMQRESDMYGIGPVSFPDSDDFAPVAIERAQVKFDTEGPSVSTDHEFVMVESELSASYLFAVLDNEELATQEGWDVSTLKRLMIDVFDKGKDIANDPSTPDGLSPMEAAIRRYKMNSFYEVHQFDRFPVIHVYVREMASPRKVSHIIVPGANCSPETKRFLFYGENEFDSMDQCLLWFSSCPADTKVSEVRGIASHLVPIERVSDRLTGAVIDSAFRAARLTLQQATPGANPTVSLSESGNTTIIAAGLEPVANPNNGSNLQAIAGIGKMVSQLGIGSVAGTDLAPISTGIKVQEGSDAVSKAEAEIQEHRRMLKDESMFNQRVTVLDKVFSESFRRFMKIVNGPSVIANEIPVVRDFIRNCRRRGLTKAMLHELPDRFMIVTCRDLVLGADGKYTVLGQILSTVSGNLDESGRRNATHDMIRLRLGRRAAERYCPVQSRDKMPTAEASFALQENNAMKRLEPVAVGMDQMHWSHIPVHAQVLEEIQQTVEQGLAEAQGMQKRGEKVQGNENGELAPQVENPEVLAQVLEAASTHIQQHLEYGGGEMGMKENARQINKMIAGLDDTIKALNLAIATQRRVREAEEEKRQREMEALEQQASEAEMQKALAKVQADKEVGLAKVQADKEIGLARLEADREVSVGKLQIEREDRTERLGLDREAARARAENDAAIARAGIENRRAESEASIETARRESQGRLGIANQQAEAANLLEQRRRFKSVTGRDVVSPSEVAQPTTPQTPPGELPL